MNRRTFTSALSAAAIGGPANALAGRIDDALRLTPAKQGIPAAVAMVASADKVLYSGAFNAKPDAIFRIASMTKAITTAAALQLVEQGSLKLDGPVEFYFPQLGALEVLEAFDASGEPILRPAKSKIELRHLLTHTSGLAYPQWDPTLAKFLKEKGAGTEVLRFDPGTRWQYGTGLDWAGRIVEKVSGLTLEAYCQQHILAPLEMRDSGFILPPDKVDRLVMHYVHESNGAFRDDPRPPPTAPKTFNGGFGMVSTAPDYVRFLQMILRQGRGPAGRILQAESVRSMTVNQIGALEVTELKSSDPAISADLILNPGAHDKYTYGFLLNPAAYLGGRSAGSLAWAGAANTFFWIDPRRELCAVLLMQFRPFLDPSAVAVLRDFELAVYAA